MTFPVVVNLGVGRSGTTYIHNVLRSVYAGRAAVLHEDINGRTARLRKYFRCYQPERIEAAAREPGIAAWVERIKSIARSQPVIVTGYTTAHLGPVLAAELGDQLRTIHVHRHPLNVVAASYIGPWSVDWPSIPTYAEDPNGRVLTPSDPHVRFNELGVDWPLLPPFARIAYQWLEMTSAAVEFPQRYPHIPHRLIDARRDVFESQHYLATIAGLLELKPAAGDTIPHRDQNAGWRRSLEERPLDDNWTSVLSLPALVTLATELGHDCSMPELERRAGRYQLPAGVASLIRHRTHYWQRRRAFAAWLRGRGVIAGRSAVAGGGAPRSTMGAIQETARFWRDRLFGRQAPRDGQ